MPYRKSVSSLRIGDILRYSNECDNVPPKVDDFTNFWHLTHVPGLPQLQLASGISTPQELKGPDGHKRRPAILISSSPHKAGSEQTPWQDVFDSDNGHIRYSGDAKPPQDPSASGINPENARGNKVLLNAFKQYSSQKIEIRKMAPPLLFFERTTVKGVQKGFVRFQGFGIIDRIELTTQFDQKKNASFANYVYDFTVFDISRDNEFFSWEWIDQRRDKSVSLEETIKYSPHSWQDWLRGGPSAVARCRRSISKLQVSKVDDQLPTKGSKEEKTLKNIYDFYDGKKHKFEGLAYAVVKKLLQKHNLYTVEGWITPPSGDGGADFILRADIGAGFACTKQIVFGQAKCVSIKTPINGRDIARTVARLKRGWFGAFVTTSYYSEPVQREIIEDQYPLMLINGKILAETVSQLISDGRFLSVQSYLQSLDTLYVGQIARRRPEEILMH